MKETLQPKLQTKSIYKPIEKEDGLRISIMSRHTLNDGKTPDPLITPESYLVWMKKLAPPDKLIGDYYKMRDMPWVKFADRYIDFLQNKDQRVEVGGLIYTATQIPVTILCVEETPEQCHRRLLAEECKRINPDLMLTLR